MNHKKIYFLNDLILVKNKRHILLVNLENKKKYVLNSHGYEFLKTIEQKSQSLPQILNILASKNIQWTKKILKFIDFLLQEKIIDFTDDMASRVYFKTSFLDPPLERIFLELTQNCNLNCRHCYLDAYSSWKGGNKNELNTRDIKRLVDLADKLGVWRFDLTGGEVFLREDLFEILEYLNKKNMIVHIFTNGTLLDSKKIEKLSQIRNIHRIILSLDGHNAALHDSFRRVSGSFEKTVTAIKQLEEKGMKTTINVSISRYNYQFIPEMVEYLRKSFKASFRLAPVLGTGRGKGFLKDIDKDVVIKEYIKQLQCMFDGNIINFIKFSPSYVPNLNTYCGIGEEFIFINSCGEIYLCPSLTSRESPELRLGNIFEDDLASIWLKNKTITNFRTIRCERCYGL